MRTNVTGFCIITEKSVAGAVAAAMSNDCLFVRLVDGYVVVGMTPLSIKMNYYFLSMRIYSKMVDGVGWKVVVMLLLTAARMQ